MQELWRHLESYLKSHAPAVLDFLNPPASENEIREAEVELRMLFPADFAASLGVHNGQPANSIPLVPQEYDRRGVYQGTFGELASLSLVIESTQRRVFKNDWRGAEFDGPVRRDGAWSWITFVDAGSGDTLGLDLNPAEGGKVGQVLSIIHDPACLLVLAKSFRDWFVTLVERYESGRYVFVDEDGEIGPIDTFQSREAKNGPEESDGTILRFPR